MRFTVVTLFPELFDGFVGTSIIKRAIEDGKITVDFVNPRDFATDKHKTVDDTPYGGGQGMLMKIDPVVGALRSVNATRADDPNREGERPAGQRSILMGARGRRFNQQVAQELADSEEHLVFVCGRYEGIDERVLEYVDEEISLGDFVLTGGELAAATMIDAVARLLPGVLGHDLSAVEESHSTPGVLEHGHYTRPVEFEGHSVPEVLMSGNHPEIAKWREEQSKKRSKKTDTSN